MLSEESERFFMEPLSSPLAAPSRPSVLASGLWYLGASSAAAVLGYCRASFSVTDLRFMTLCLFSCIVPIYQSEISPPNHVRLHCTRLIAQH